MSGYGSNERDDRPDAGAHTDLADQLTYGRYLALDELLRLQRPVSRSPDELLFIVIHQATELWLKLMIHELRLARERIAHDRLPEAFKVMARVTRVQAQLDRKSVV